MRRALLCCALFAMVAGACSGSAATYGPAHPPQNGAPAATYAAAPTMAAMAPEATPYVWQTPYPWTTPYPWATQPNRQYPYPPVTFPDLGTNPYVDTTRDNLSTFGLDVDTASYTVARGYVAQGLRPDAASVRPEEWVNYFDQGYSAPETGAFAIHADGAPTPFLSANEVLVRVGVSARAVSTARRPSAALTFVVDVSGSMEQSGRLELVKQSLALLATQLRSDDRVSIVAFSTEARVVLRSTSGDRRDQIIGALAQLAPEDTTNADAGLRLGYELARAQMLPGGINRVILATDGVANVGNEDAATMLRNAGADSASHIQLVAIGVGMGNFNDALLEQLADQGAGFYAYVDTFDEAKRIFVDELTKTIDTVALDAKAQIEFNVANVAGYRLIGYEDRDVPDGQFRSPSAKGGAIGAGHQVTALYALVLRSSESQDGRLATVSLRWTDPGTMRATEIAQDIDRADLSRTFGAADPHFRFASLVAATAEVLRNSPWIPGYRISDLRSAADEMRSQLPQTTEVRDFMQLLDQIRNW
jgi:Ca-activated chloride channel family protein